MEYESVDAIIEGGLTGNHSASYYKFVTLTLPADAAALRDKKRTYTRDGKPPATTPYRLGLHTALDHTTWMRGPLYSEENQRFLSQDHLDNPRSIWLRDGRMYLNTAYGADEDYRRILDRLRANTQFFFTQDPHIQEVYQQLRTAPSQK